MIRKILCVFYQKFHIKHYFISRETREESLKFLLLVTTMVVGQLKKLYYFFYRELSQETSLRVMFFSRVMHTKNCMRIKKKERERERTKPN